MAIFTNNPTYSLFRKLAQIRLDEAKLLFSKGKYNGAYYLSGYTLELAIKAYYCKKLGKYPFPPKPEVVKGLYIHDLTSLMANTELIRDLDNDLKTNLDLQKNWLVAKDWSEDSRYTINKKAVSDAMLKAVQIIFNWIQTKW